MEKIGKEVNRERKVEKNIGTELMKGIKRKTRRQWGIMKESDSGSV